MLLSIEADNFTSKYTTPKENHQLYLLEDGGFTNRGRITMKGYDLLDAIRSEEDWKEIMLRYQLGQNVTSAIAHKNWRKFSPEAAEARQKAEIDKISWASMFESLRHNDA